jgi:hypothetical protein
LYAEKKCRKLAMGEVDFSPELNKARQRKLLWKKIVWHKRGRRVSSSYIKRKARQCTLEQALQYRKTAINKYEKLKPIAELLRKDHLWNLANDRSDKATEDSRKHAKCLLREEMQREAARHLRRAMEQTSNGAVDWIKGDGDNDNVEPIRITDQPTMEQRIMENNSR